jgi:DNA repair protein RecO (recombination protein O)
MNFRAEGIVIRSMDYGEGHKIITLFTKDTGKISVMARGAKKLKSRHTSVSQLFTHGEYALFKSSGMASLNQGEVIDSNHRLREDLHLAAYSAYLVEIVDRTMPDEEPNGMVFEQLKAGLTAIESGKDAMIVLHIMEMKMLALSGYLPQLDECVSCGSDQGEMVLSVAQGGILCPDCRFRDAAAMPLSEGTLKLLRLFQRIDLRRLGSIEVKEQTKTQLKLAIRAFIDLHMDVRWKSRNFLDQMEKYGI